MERWTHRLMSGLVVATVTMGLLAPTPAVAVATELVDCNHEAQTVGSKMPVIMVHGLFGSIGIWGSAQDSQGTMFGTLSILSEVHQIMFDYSSNLSNIKWITDPNVGPKLAETVTCLANASKKNGGPGKVAIIGHSMGGLAAQYAAAQVPDKVGPVITIGTPYKGSILGNLSTSVINSLCSFAFPLKGVYEQYVTKENCAKALAFTGLSISSKELAELPPFPPSVSVKAIAGNITPQMQLGMVKITGAPLNSDAVVHVPSALGTFTATGRGDGKKEISCTGFLVFASMSDAPCEHSRLVNDPAVQQEVKTALEQYIASTKTPAIDFFGLGLRPGPEWQMVKGGDFDTASRKTLVDATCAFPETPAGCNETVIVVNTNGPENEDPYGDPRYKARDLDCYGDKLHEDASFGSPETVGTIMVDGEKAEHQVLTGCNLYGGGTPGEPTSGRLHIWRIPSRGVLVYIVLLGTDGADKRVEAVESLLQNASWK